MAKYNDRALHEEMKEEVFADGSLIKFRVKEAGSKPTKKSKDLMLTMQVDVLNPEDESRTVRAGDVRSVNGYVGLPLENDDVDGHVPNYKWVLGRSGGPRFIQAMFPENEKIQDPHWEDGCLIWADEEFTQEEVKEDPKIKLQLKEKAGRARGELMLSLYEDASPLEGLMGIGRLQVGDGNFTTVSNIQSKLYGDQELTPLEDLVVLSGGLDSFEDDEDDDLIDDDDE